MKIHEIFTLDSGIRVIHNKSRSQVAQIAITVGAGTRDELEKEHGIAHLTEHMLFRGTTKHSAYQIANRIESRGGELNAYTTKEETVLHCTALSRDAARTTELLAEMLFQSRMKPKDIESEKEIIIDEINSYKDTPSELIFDHFEEQLFAGSSLGRNILGDKRNLKKMGEHQIINYLKRTFTTDQIVLTASTNLSHKRFKEIATKTLGSIQKTTREFTRQKTTPVAPIDIVCNKNTYQTHALLGTYAPSLNSELRIPTAMLTNILGGPSSISLLNQALREKRSLTYNVEANYTPYHDSGLLSVYFSCEDQKHEQAYNMTEKIIKDICSKELSSAKFNAFKRQFLSSLIMSNENTEGLMLAIGKSMVTFGKFDSRETIYKKLEKLTATDMINAANEIFSQTLCKLTYK